jgi:translation elongation factor EF-Ts
MLEGKIGTLYYILLANILCVVEGFAAKTLNEIVLYEQNFVLGGTSAETIKQLVDKVLSIWNQPRI